MAIASVTLLGLLLSASLPNAFVEYSGDPACPQNLDSYQGFCTAIQATNKTVWKSSITDIEKLDGFLSISVEAERDVEKDLGRFSFELSYSAILTPVDQNDQAIGENIKVTDHPLQFVMEENSIFSESRILILLNKLDHRNYKAVVTLALPEAILPALAGFNFYAVTMNAPFSYFLILFRYIMFFFSLASFVLYVISLVKMNPADRTFEHKAIFLLSIAAVLFNDPLFAATFISASFGFTVISNCFVSLFAAGLVLFWSVMLPRVHTEKQQVGTRKLTQPKIFLAVLVFLVLAGTTSAVSYITRFDPSFDLDYAVPAPVALLKALATLLFFALVVVLCWQIKFIYDRWKEVITRHRFFLFLSAFYLAVVLYLGLAGLYQSLDTDGPKITLLFLITNFYVSALQFYWTPTSFDRSNLLFSNAERLPTYITPGQQHQLVYHDPVRSNQYKSFDESEPTPHKSDQAKESIKQSENTLESI